MLRRLGVRGRLLLAFFGISAFAVLAAAAAMHAFLQVGGALDRITERRMPAALGSLELAGQAERLVATAPVLLGATSRTQHEERSARIALQIGSWSFVCTNLAVGGTGVFAPIHGYFHVASGLFDTCMVVAEEKMSPCKPTSQAAFNSILPVTPG